ESSNQEKQQEYDLWNEDQRTDDDDEVPSEEATPKFLAEMLRNGKKCERNPNAPPRYLYNKDLFNLKNGNSETRKYVLSLHKVHAFLFPENDLEELNTRWLKKKADLDEVYSDQRIVDIIKIQYDQGHGQEFMKEIVGKRVDGEFSSFSESDYKY
ncbi:hypothetical protein Tco_0135798, partial [Tanacetum coccineum]